MDEAAVVISGYVGSYALASGSGAGAFARVYQADHVANGRRVALKIPRAQVRQRLETSHRNDLLVAAPYREIFERLSHLRYPQLATILDYGVSLDGQNFLVMDWVAGRPLSARVLPCPETEAIAIGREIACGLAALHLAGLVHGDLSPDNVLQGDDGAITLIDLDGAAPALAASAGDRGTPLYMAPEALRGAPPEPAGDLYSLGALLYRLVTGAAPFEGRENDAVLDAAMHEVPEALTLRVPGLSPGLSDLVARLLAKTPADRPDGAQTVVAALDGLSDTGPVLRLGAGRFVATESFERFAAAAGQPGVTAFVGEGGLGRSRALDEAFAHLRREGHQAVVVRPRPGDGPYGLLGQIWRWATVMAPDAASDLSPSLKAIVAAFWPEAYPHVKPADEPGRLARVLIEVVGLLLGRVASGQTLTVLVDDWETADEASREAIATGWLSPLAPFAWVLAAQAPVAGAVTQRLRGFNEGESLNWLRSVAWGWNQSAIQALAPKLVAVSGGNPGWMAIALRQFATDASQAVDGWEPPPNSEALMAAAWHSLDHEARRLAEVLAVYGAPLQNPDLDLGQGAVAVSKDGSAYTAPFPLGDWHTVRPLLPTPWDSAHAALLAAGVLRGDRFAITFAHGWWPAWLVRQMSPAHHQAIATQLADSAVARFEASRNDPEPPFRYELPLHRVAKWYAAGNNPHAALRWSLAAGKAAARVWANAMALSHFETAVQAFAACPEDARDPTTLFHLKVAQADVWRVVGRVAEAAAAYVACLALLDDPHLPPPGQVAGVSPTTERALARARVGVSLGKAQQMLNQLAQAQTSLQEALACLDRLVEGNQSAAETDKASKQRPATQAAVRVERVRALTTLARVAFYAGDRQAAIAASERALSDARAVELATWQAEAASFLGSLLVQEAATLDRGFALLHEALDLREASGDPLGLNDTHMLVGNALMATGRYREARLHFARNEALSHEIGYHQEGALAVLNQALCDAEQGDWSASLARAERAFLTAEAIHYPFLAAFASYTESLARLHVGDVMGAFFALERAQTLETDLNSAYVRDYGLVYQAEIALFLGDFARARACANELVQRLELAGGGELALKAYALLAEALVFSGDFEAATSYLGAVSRLVASSGASAPWALARRIAGWFAIRRGDQAAARENWLAGLSLAREQGLNALVLDLLLALAMTGGGGSELEEALALAETLRTPDPLAIACLALAEREGGAGNLAAADRLNQRGEELWARLTVALPDEAARERFRSHPARLGLGDHAEVARSHRLAAQNRRLDMLLDLARTMGASRTPDAVLQQVVTFVKEATGAERCLVLLAGKAGGDMAAWGAEPGQPTAYSKSVVARAITTGKPACVLDTRLGQALQVSASVADLQLHSVMCVPLAVEQVLHGVLYLDSRVALTTFGADDLAFVTAIAAQAAVALDNARLFQALRLQSERQSQTIRQLEERDGTIASLRAFDEARTAAFEAESHDLRAPLGALSAAGQGLIKGLDGPLNAAQQETLTGMLRAARMLGRKIDGVLDAAGAQAGKLTLRLKDHDLLAIAEEIALALTPSAEAKGLKIHLDRPTFAGLPPVRVDERRIGQVLQNLVDNAIKYTEVGTISILAAEVAESTTLTVADTGPGMLPERLANPFERYGARDAQVPGSGVGLWRVKGLMDQHGGDVAIASEPGRGTRITLHFPRWPTIEPA